jgi:hypothetical protein
MKTQRAWPVGEFRLPLGEALGDMPGGPRPPEHPGEIGATARIARDAVACVAARCGVPAWAAVAAVAVRLRVGKADVRRFAQEGIEAPPQRSAILDVTEELERRAGGPWAGHVPAALKTLINTERM